MGILQWVNQVENLDFDETFPSFAHLKATQLCLYALLQIILDGCQNRILNGHLHEEVYVSQIKGFDDSYHFKYVYKLKKALYGLKQARWAWYERLIKYLIKKGYSKGIGDRALLSKKSYTQVLVVQVYVHDIVFGETSKKLVDEFVMERINEFEMSMVGVLAYFLGLQVKQIDSKCSSPTKNMCI